VRAALAHAVPELVSPFQVARSLGFSQRSLQRILERNGTSYARVLSETRRELACGYLCERRHSVSDIASCLGFSDASSFARAFKRWTGTSPSQYRRAMLGA
jgi:AraC-like DNA-binding protein